MQTGFLPYTKRNPLDVKFIICVSLIQKKSLLVLTEVEFPFVIFTDPPEFQSNSFLHFPTFGLGQGNNSTNVFLTHAGQGKPHQVSHKETSIDQDRNFPFHQMFAKIIYCSET
jgi:hypothetical protein